MTPSRKIHDLATQIEALEPEARLELLRQTLTPEMKLCLLVEDLSQRAAGWNPEEVERDIDEAVREVRRARRSNVA